MKRAMLLAVLALSLGTGVRADGTVTGASVNCAGESFSDVAGALNLSTFVIYSPCSHVLERDAVSSEFNMEMRIEGNVVGPSEGMPILDLVGDDIRFPRDPQGTTFTIIEPAFIDGQLYGCDANGCGLFSFFATGTLTVNFTQNGPGAYDVSNVTYQFGDPSASSVPETPTFILLALGLSICALWESLRRFAKVAHLAVTQP